MDSYVLIMPPIYFGEGSPVLVKPLINLKDSSNNAFGEEYSTTLKNVFSNPNIGRKSNVKMFNPWYTTKIYDLTENESEAKYIISGEYFSGTGLSDTAIEHKTAETSTSVDPKIPFVFYEYTSTSSASVNGKLTVYQTSSSKVVKEYPFAKTNTDSKSQYLESVKSASMFSLLDKSEDQAINEHILAFSPSYIIYTYKFENVKSDDKDYNKELRQQRSDLDDYADAGQLDKLALAYIEMLDKNIKNPEDLYFNLGMSYEMLGNFTKAKEYYDKSNNSEAIERIGILINYRDIYEKLGIEIIEKDFV